MTAKKIRLAMVLVLITAYLVLAVCDLKEGKIRTGVVSVLFAAVTWLVFF